MLSALMSALAFVVEKRLVRALRQGTVRDARPARAPADVGGGLSAQPGPGPRAEHVGEEAGGQHAPGSAERQGDPALDPG